MSAFFSQKHFPHFSNDKGTCICNIRVYKIITESAYVNNEAKGLPIREEMGKVASVVHGSIFIKLGTMLRGPVAVVTVSPRQA